MGVSRETGALAATLRHARRASGLSYRALSEESGLAVSHLQRLLSGEVGEPSVSTLRKVAGPLRLDVAQLVRLL